MTYMGKGRNFYIIIPYGRLKIQLMPSFVSFLQSVSVIPDSLAIFHNFWGEAVATPTNKLPYISPFSAIYREVETS